MLRSGEYCPRRVEHRFPSRSVPNTDAVPADMRGQLLSRVLPIKLQCAILFACE